MALRSAALDEDLVYFGDNQSVLKTIQKWTGEGSRATLANAPDADILSEALEILRKRIANGAVTILAKVKARILSKQIL
jgi:hypothetical protein